MLFENAVFDTVGHANAWGDAEHTDGDFAQFFGLAAGFVIAVATITATACGEQKGCSGCQTR